MTRGGMAGHERFSDSVEWYTPAHVFDALGLAFDLDPCAPPGGLPWVPAREFYSADDDGLSRPWSGRVWLNPPYGPGIGEWMRRLAAHGDGVALVFARTDTRWFHETAPSSDAVCFIEGRLTFISPGRDQATSAGAPSLLVAWGRACAEAVARSGLGPYVLRARPSPGRPGLALGAPVTPPLVDDGDLRIYVGDARAVLRDLPAGSVHAVATSPPFYGLRDYGTGEWEGGDPACAHEQGGTEGYPGGRAGRCSGCGAARVDQQIGLEPTLEEWAASLVDVFGEARRVLRDDGSLWIECGDSYASDGGTRNPNTLERTSQRKRTVEDGTRRPSPPLKEKDLVLAPFALALALRADGWYLRGTYVWEKPDAMPESVADRCTVSHSYVFHFAKMPRYFFDRDAIREPFSTYASGGVRSDGGGLDGAAADGVRPSMQLDLEGGEAAPEVRGPDGRRELHVEAGSNSAQHRDGSRWPNVDGRSPRSVWRITTEASSFGLCPVCRRYWDRGAPAHHCGADVVAHFAVWPHELVGKIVRAATSEAGCCADCGAPRVRGVANEITNPGNRSNNGQRGRSGERRGFDVRREVKVTTTGWEPTCACDAPSVPCVVLDPFGGSATTARQARALGRACWIVELSPDYAEIAVHRTRQLSLLSAGGE